MIANPKWFKRRKYSGWGLTPNTWQGWLYIIGIVFTAIAVVSTANLFAFTAQTQRILFTIITGLVIADVIDTMRKFKQDERETFHEALSERNVTWFMISVLVLGLVYEAYASVISGVLQIDPFIMIALLGGTIVKAISNLYFLDK